MLDVYASLFGENGVRSICGCESKPYLPNTSTLESLQRPAGQLQAEQALNGDWKTFYASF